MFRVGESRQAWPPFSVLSSARDAIAPHQVRNWGLTRRSRWFADRLTEHPGTEADLPLVLGSPLFSMARGVAVASLVTRAVTRA
jgi:hypothetical protein